MIEDIVVRIARDTAHLENKIAWAEIQARLKWEGVPKGQLSTLRDSIWFERRRHAVTIKQGSGVSSNARGGMRDGLPGGDIATG
jgi:hypothetical protein